ncbi:2-dehydro-3-deoxyglucarate aldolase [Halogranum rubrum]|uniref:2-dehydro-3-deoxyglucarate aldolase n=1 Tax=Halogranum rubrum TaxID=553466 RepID=A0A1I4D5X0_9EURY|nr:aldolase/citrate lyase family protein [Halogranum rubrum]SFK89124.1 2-dehydro-3-deoxyglucarate aldolase [Halogranum rubrum]
MTTNTLRTALDADTRSLATRVICPWPGVIEVLGQTDAFDYVEFAAEYAPFDLHDLDHIARTAELSGLSTMIKVDAEPRTYLAQRAMAAGIQNVLFVDIRTAEDAREAVRAVRAEPTGTNGVRKDRRNGYVGGYASPEEIVTWCDDAVVALMIEKREAMENLEDILAVEGVDMVQFGPVDYALSIGNPGGRHSEEVQQAQREMIDMALDVGVTPRAEIKMPDNADDYLDRGVSHFSLDTDVNILHRFWQEQGTELGNRLDDVAHD